MYQSSITIFIISCVALSAHAKKPDFAKEVLPILSDKCFACHGPDAKKKDIRLDSFEHATKDLDGYKAIDPDNLEESEVIYRMFDEDDPMPPKDAEKQLTKEEREILTQWIKGGAKYAKHWAYVPPIKDREHKNIDEFIKAEFPKGKTFAPEADKRTLARRASLTLRGLPPSIDELNTFLNDQGPRAYESYLDRLLASSSYGEHQARYWLDAIRYGDTHGLHLDNRRAIYPYRDWVIMALNENLSMKDFITWQLAGDLLPNPSLEQQVATGFIRMNPTTGEGGAIPEEFQAKNNFDRVENLGTVLLGTSMQCVRCHTHKYDPIYHDEYFKLMAFFNNTAESPVDGNRYDYAPVVKAPSNIHDWKAWNKLRAQGKTSRKPVFTAIETQNSKTATPKAKYQTYTFEMSQLDKQVDGLKLEILNDKQLKNDNPKTKQFYIKKIKATFLFNDGKEKELEFDSISGTSSHNRFNVDNILKKKSNPGWRIDLTKSFNHNATLTLAERLNTQAGDKLKIELHIATHAIDLKRFKFSTGMHLVPQTPFEKIEHRFATTMVAKEGKVRPTYLLDRGEYNMPKGEALEADVPAIFGKMPDSAPKNRLGLAQWLTSPEHPTVARVLVNRIWQRVFAYGLVRSPEDFGLQGDHPTHPELLDFLALEFHKDNWDLKKTLKKMLMSKTFRQSSAFRKDINDPENKLFARGPSYRMDAEIIRDIGLWSSQLLDKQMGGEGVKPYQPAGMWLAMAHPSSNTKIYERDKGKKLYRKSLYVYWKRTSPHPMMSLFDAPDREVSCVKRNRSNTPLQSLALFNETMRIEMSRKLAERLINEKQSDEERLDLIFTLLASRSASSHEKQVCLELLKDLKTEFKATPAKAKDILAVGDSANDSTINTIEQAAWSQLAATLLASDLALLVY
ncbi:PSD1 and planctomycete cytochrome C domain-containing protein [Lentisphaera marina]|uniref:PSD1 and planctomycete cytochrome C domain-containing protein n=1 Tax=Lentisphaera marina TaxID=1111041 RepID=UPI00236698E6|nr:PSD1 and planctomycete cytochrome C domain-containing protein [Lentisphaera marina]MDD7983874.1 PSD1 and planctomycete cytochrome C domain-containing protein [Lentisphaera marina]